MPAHSPVSRGSIQQLINRQLEVLSANKKESHKAAARGDLEAVQALAKGRIKIKDTLEDLLELRDEIYLSSGMPSDEAEARLKGAAKSARGIARAAKEVEGVLTAIAKLADLVAALIGAVKAF